MTEKKFVDLLEKKFKKDGYITKRELGVGYGVADLVLFKLDPKKCKIRVSNKQFDKITNEDSFHIFNLLPEVYEKKSVDLEYISKNLNIPLNSLKYKHLKKLEEDGFIQVINNCYFKKNGWMPIAREIIAIEAKLKDWKRGFIQANRYKSFANKSFLAVPKKIGHLVDLKLLKKHDIGLIVFDTEKDINNVSRIKRMNPLNINKYNLASEFVIERGRLNKCAL